MTQQNTEYQNGYTDGLFDGKLLMIKEIRENVCNDCENGCFYSDVCGAGLNADLQDCDIGKYILKVQNDLEMIINICRKDKK